MYSERRQRLVKGIRARRLDALALVPGPNLFYLTGLSFHLSERPIVALFPADGNPAVILPQLEAVKLGESQGMTVFSYSDVGGHEGAFRDACEALGLGASTIGAEELGMRLMEARLLEQHARGSRIIPAGDAVFDLRICKDEQEQGQMRSAAAVTEQALGATIDQIAVGMTERELAALLRIHLLGAGADTMAFSPIVAAGPNAALPHATPGNRPVQAGETIILDCGASVGGYAADITRTVVLDALDPGWSEVYDVVQAANAAGREAVRPDVPAEEVDRATRDVIEDAGYGDYFVHRTGHGLGLEIHEPPYIVAGNGRRLRPGMVLTVEPGIYVPGEGGVRIEDDVLVTKDGAQSLTTFTRDLTVLPL